MPYEIGDSRKRRGDRRRSSYRGEDDRAEEYPSGNLDPEPKRNKGWTIETYLKWGVFIVVALALVLFIANHSREFARLFWR